MFGRKKTDEKKLDLWKSRFQACRSAYSAERNRMNRREELYKGTKTVKSATGKSNTRDALHVRNVCAELVESQASSSIPQPKVTAIRAEDEGLAKVIEDMLRNELDRLPMEYNNDQEERTVPIQGGSLSLVEWDSEKRTHFTTGALSVSVVHPRAFTPQDGVVTDIEDMDYWFLEVPRTKAYIKRRYGVNVSDEGEESPDIRGGDEESPADDMVTQVIAYYKNDQGGVGLISWVGDSVLEDLEDYQARRVYICEKCGQPGDGHECAYCKAKTKWREETGEEETLLEDVVRSDGTVIPAWSPVLDELGRPVSEPVTDAFGNAVLEPKVDMLGNPMVTRGAYGMPEPVMESKMQPMMKQTKIPYYKPNVYPVLLRKNVSVFGRFLGDSDIDKIEDQQESIKKIETKLIDKIFHAGAALMVPYDVDLNMTDKDFWLIRVRDAAQASMVGVHNLQPNISGDMAFLSQVYEEARQIIGITDSFQGRKDPTATSGVAKEFSAKQSAGRLESKRTMKDAYYSRLFEVMFKFALAYADEPREVVATDNQGRVKYETFNRYDFLQQDETGEYYWNDRFLFSVDASATLAQNREALWQECRMNFQQGCFGPPQELETLVVFWTRMEALHYPGASDTKTYLEEKLQEQKAAQAAAAQMRQAAEAQAMAAEGMAI